MKNASFALPAPMNARRIVVLNDSFDARGGGTQLARRLVAGLAARGDDVTFLTADGGAAQCEGVTDRLELLGQVVETQRFPGQRIDSMSRGRGMIVGLSNRAAARALSNWIAENDTPRTVYHLHIWQQAFSPRVFSVLAPVAGRLVLHAHDFFLACPKGDFTTREGICQRRPLGPACIVSSCDRRGRAIKIWQVVRAAIRSRSMAPGGDRPLVAMIHPGQAPYLERAGYAAGALRLARNPVERPARPAACSPHTRSAAIYSGRLTQMKGVLDAAEACRRVGMRLIVAGTGPAERELASMPHVEFLGWVDRDTLREAMSRARMLIMPSLWPEPFGLVSAEALAEGLPIVVSDRALVGTEVEEAGAGVRFRAGDPEDLARVLRSLDDRRIKQMAQAAPAALDVVASTFSDWLDGISSLYDEVLASTPGEPHTVCESSA